MSSQAPPIVPPIDSFERRATARVLDFMAAISVTTCVLALLGRMTSLHDQYPLLAQFAPLRVVVNSVGAISFIVLARLYRRGTNWPVPVVVLGMTITLVAGMRDSLFATGVPQMIWIPALVAFALTSLRWLLVTIALTAVVTIAAHGHTAALHTAPALFASLIIAALLVLSRVLHDLSLTNAREQALKIKELALFDPLTALPNRRLLVDRLEEGIKRSKRSNLPLAVLFVDLDRFKEVNDTLGHKAGDQLLAEAAKRISACVRTSDTVARFGGDEFVLVLPELTDRNVLARIATQINARLAEAFHLADKPVHVSGSVGIAVYPDDGEENETLLKHADQALYQSKNTGRDRFSFYTPAMQQAASQRRQLTDDLRAALASENQKLELELFYQPIVAMQSGAVLKAVALMRWHHAELGAVSPATFIPLAESSGLIHPLGEWVLATAALQVRSWRADVDETFQVSVNWSPVQFRNKGGERCTWNERLARLNLPSGALALEVTEGVLVDNTPHAAAQFACLRRAGVAVSVDDFGTGYSGLAYLQRYAIDCVKIDQAFVRSLTVDARTLGLCKAIIVMAHELGMSVVAEGVETVEEHEMLLNAGADFAQGFYYARPMPAAEFATWLQQRAVMAPMAAA